MKDWLLSKMGDRANLLSSAKSSPEGRQ